MKIYGEVAPGTKWRRVFIFTPGRFSSGGIAASTHWVGGCIGMGSLSGHLGEESVGGAGIQPQFLSWVVSLSSRYTS
jgi:hypothetical protein